MLDVIAKRIELEVDSIESTLSPSPPVLWETELIGRHRLSLPELCLFFARRSFPTNNVIR